MFRHRPTSNSYTESGERPTDTPPQRTDHRTAVEDEQVGKRFGDLLGPDRTRVGVALLAGAAARRAWKGSLGPSPISGPAEAS